MSNISRFGKKHFPKSGRIFYFCRIPESRNRKRYKKTWRYFEFLGAGNWANKINTARDKSYKITIVITTNCGSLFYGYDASDNYSALP